MIRTTRPGGLPQTLFQLLLGAFALGALFFAPPASGRMVVVPLGAGAATRAPGLVLKSGAQMIGRGPVRGSLVIEGERAALFGTLLSAGSLLVAASPAGCGPSSKASLS